MITVISFLSFYPQFSSFADGIVLPEYLRQANARFGDFGEDADEARRLYAAHKLTLYSASTPPGNVAPAPAGEEPTTAGGGSFVGSEVTGNEQSPQWGAATIDGAERRYTMAQLSAAGRGALQEVSSRKVGEVSVTYSETSSDSSVSTGLADLKKTAFGLQLLSLLRLYGFSRYIP